MNKIKTVTRLGICVIGGSLAAACSNSTTSTGQPATGSSEPEALHIAVCPETVGKDEARCHSRIVVDEHGKPIINHDALTGLIPSQLVSAYGIPSGGKGTTVAVVDAFDNPDAETDLATYRTKYGLPACTSASGCFQKVNQTGAASPLPKADTIGWGEEIALDIEMVSAACPACNIILVEVNGQTLADLGVGVDSAVALGATAISNSYGFGDSTTYSKYEKHYNHHGVFITASTGDSGYGTNYPAESEWVTAVGGTTLKTATNSRGWTETAWSEGGSGCSSFAKKPTWQKDTGCTFRMEADVAAVGNPSTGVAFYDKYEAGGWGVVGGTSVAAPLVAAMFAAGGKTGLTPGYSYLNPGNFFDITSGKNGTCSPAYFCTAGVGYDGPTGNGSPNMALIK